MAAQMWLPGHPIEKGATVSVKSRTSPGYNSPGGPGRIIAVHHDTCSYDVKYIMGLTRKLRRKRYVAHLPSSAATDAVPADVRSDADLVAARTEDVFFSGVREEARVFRPRARLDAPLD